MDEQGVVQLANEAARRALRVRDDPVGRRYVELVRHPDIEAQISRALRGEPTDAQELTIAQDPAQMIMAQATPCLGRRLAGRRAGAPRHHRPAPRRSHPPRLRRQRLARAAHAAHRDPRLRRGAARSGAARRRAAPLPRHHRAPFEPHGGPGQGSAAPDPPRGRPGTARSRRPARRRTSSTASSHDLEPLLARRHQQVDDRGRAGRRRRSSAIPAKLHDVLRNLVENAANYAPEGTTITLSAQPRRRSRRAHGRGRGAGHSRGRPASACSSASTASTRRARARPAAPAWVCRSSSTWSACTAATSASRTAPTGGARFIVRIPA